MNRPQRCASAAAIAFAAMALGTAPSATAESDVITVTERAATD